MSNKMTSVPLIGFYKNREALDGLDMSILDFLDGIRSGIEWRKHVEWVRASPDIDLPYQFDSEGKKIPKEYDTRKEKSPCVTIAATFKKGGKSKANRDKFSGLMPIDLDHLGERVESVKLELSQSDFCFSVFKSIGGKGLCFITRVDPERWDDAFKGIQRYLLDNFGIVGKEFDLSSSNFNRLRYVSYDPDVYVNEYSKLFNKYPPKKPEPKRPAVVHSDRDIDYILQQIQSRSLDLTVNYNDWYRIGWALIAQYGEGARELFHAVSVNNPGYDSEECDKKFNYLNSTRPHSITIKTFYYHCKMAGLDIATPETKSISSVAAMSKKQHSNVKGALDVVLKMTASDKETALPIIQQVFDSPEDFEIGETLFHQIELYLMINYPMRFNLITRYAESPDGKRYEERDINSIYRSLTKEVSEKVKYFDLEKLIRSDFVTAYNPFTEFFNRHKKIKSTGHIKALAETVVQESEAKERDPDFVLFFLTKWLLGIIDSMLGGHSPLALIFTGGMNIGKTEWFRRLLPDELQEYFGESELDKGQDDEILMCKKLILFNDEFGGMTRHDVKRFKNLTSKQVFSLREPYGKAHVDLRRIAVLCGTSNEKDLINDPEGNRRIIPVHAIDFKKKEYNQIDKVALIMEAYYLYTSGQRHHLSPEEKKRLEEGGAEFEQLSEERELIQKYFTVPDSSSFDVKYWSQTDIKVFLEKMSNLRLRPKILSQEMLRQGFKQIPRTIKGKSKRGYELLCEVQYNA